MYHSTDLTARGVAHLVVHGTRGSTSYEMIPPVRLETSGGELSTVDMVMQRRDGPRRLYATMMMMMTIRNGQPMTSTVQIVWAAFSFCMHKHNIRYKPIHNTLQRRQKYWD